MAGKNRSQETKGKKSTSENKKKGGCFWTTLMVIGVLSLTMFCILSGGILLEGSDAVVNWGEIGPVLIISLVLGGGLIYFASRHVDFGKDKQPAQAPVKARSAGSPLTPASAVQTPAAKSLLQFSTGDIMCMAVVYEGYLPQGHVLNQREFAEEIISSAHKIGLPEHIHLAPDTLIQAKRADENAYYAGNYEPKDDLPAMMNSMVSSLRGRVSVVGQTSGLLNTKQMMFKSWSPLASTVWVSLTVVQ